MATIALTAAASGAGMPAYFAAALTGSIIDNSLIMPTLFPPDPIDGMRIGEMSVSGADEGDPVSMVFGQYAVTQGEYIWLSQYFRESTETKRVGKSGTQIERTYYTDAAVAISYCGERWSPGRIESVDQVFFNEKRVYVNAGTTPPTTVTANGLFIYNYGSEAYVFFDDTVNATVKDDMWAKFDAGDTITWSGWTNAANNDSNDRILEKLEQAEAPSYGSSTRTLPAWRMQLGKVTEQTTQSVGTLNRPGGNSYDITVTGVANTGWADGLWVGADPEARLGDHVNNWVVYENEVGEENAPAWSDMAWMPLRFLRLNEFGGRLPSVRFVVSAHSSLRNPQGVIGHILLQGGLTASEYDVSGVDNTASVLGYTLRGPVEMAKALQPIMLAFDIVAQERGGTIYFFDRADQVANTHSLEADFLGATSGNDIAGGKVTIQEVPRDQLPSEVEVSFQDFNDGNLGRGIARAHRLSEDSTRLRDTNHRGNKLSINLDLTTTEDDARQIAWRMLTQAHADNLMFEFTLPPRYIWLQENDRVQFTTGGTTYDALIRKVDLGANFLLEVTASLDVAVNSSYTDWTV